MAQRILVVEDEPVVLAFARTVLQQRGYHVIAAQSIAEARQALATPACADIRHLVVDVVLGDESGIAFAHDCIARDSEFRVLLISGFTDDVLVGAAEHADRMSFLRKPFTRDELITAVDGICERAVR